MRVLIFVFGSFALCFGLTGKQSILHILQRFQNNDVLDKSETSQLSHAKLVDLPLALRKLVERTPEGEHLCCRSTPIKLVTKSRRVARVSVVEDKQTHSDDCGFLNAGTCQHQTATYRKVTRYITEYYRTPIEGQCPERHIVCCNLYIMVSNKCVHLDDLHEVAMQILG